MTSRLGPAARERMAANGVAALAPPVALAALGRLLEEDAGFAAAIALDWSRFRRTAGHAARGDRVADRFIEDFAVAEPAVPATAPRDATPPRDAAALPDFVAGEIRAVLALPKAAPIGPRERLFDLGVDSLMAVELRDRLAAGLGITLRPTLVFDFPTFEALVAHLADTLGPPRSADTDRTASWVPPHGLDRPWPPGPVGADLAASSVPPDAPGRAPPPEPADTGLAAYDTMGVAEIDAALDARLREVERMLGA